MKNKVKSLLILVFFIQLLMYSHSAKAFLWIHHKKARTQVVQSQSQNNDEVIDFDYYNKFPGTQIIDLSKLLDKKQSTSIGVISPDKSKIAFTQVYFYPQILQTSSRAFYIDLSSANGKLTKNILRIDDPQNPPISILESNYNDINEQVFRTLSIVDWSQDSKKLLLKEKIGENFEGFWSTNMWVYDFSTNKAYNLKALGKAVLYFWRIKYNIDLRNYRWDIIPLGWSINNSNQIIANIYGYSNDEKKFIGCWAIDYKGTTPKLLSLYNENMAVGKYGLIFSN